MDCVPNCADSNAIQYYKLSDELEGINELIFDFLMNLSAGYYAMIVLIVIVTFLFYMIFYVRRSMEVVSRGG